MESPRFRHLLLDLDGTLIHSGNFLTPLEFVFRLLPQMKKYKGWKIAWQSLKECGAALKKPSSTETNHARMVSIFQKNFQLSRAEAEENLFQSLHAVFSKLEPHFGKIEGAADFVEWAKDRYPLVLATNPVWPVDFIKMRMKWGGLNPAHFQSVTTWDRMHACKPSVEYYREILSQENFKPEECLLIGNERKMDLPARAAGIAVFLLRPEAKKLTTIESKTKDAPHAWRGNFAHLKAILEG